MVAYDESSSEIQTVEIEIFCIDSTLLGEVQADFLVKPVDNETKSWSSQFHYLLLMFGHVNIISKQKSQPTDL
jgi:hypothetical protein